jgi:hypothetical protein
VLEVGAVGPEGLLAPISRSASSVHAGNAGIASASWVDMAGSVIGEYEQAEHDEGDEVGEHGSAPDVGGRRRERSSRSIQKNTEKSTYYSCFGSHKWVVYAGPIATGRPPPAGFCPPSLSFRGAVRRRGVGSAETERKTSAPSRVVFLPQGPHGPHPGWR